MCLRRRGAQKFSHWYVGLKLQHWKGSILNFKQGVDGSKQVLILHFYKALQFHISNVNCKYFLINCKFCLCFLIVMRSNMLSTSFSWLGSVKMWKFWFNVCADIFLSIFTKWEAFEALLGTFEAHHYEVRKLLYFGYSASKLSKC